MKDNFEFNELPDYNSIFKNIDLKYHQKHKIPRYNFDDFVIQQLWNKLNELGHKFLFKKELMAFLNERVHCIIKDNTYHYYLDMHTTNTFLGAFERTIFN